MSERLQEVWRVRSVQNTRRRGLAAEVLLLESRQLLTLVVGQVNAIEGVTFQGRVATFDAADVTGSINDFKATIDWGDGSKSQGTIAEAPSNAFTIDGSHLYAKAGNYPILITLTGTGTSKKLASGQALVEIPPPAIRGIVASAGVSFDGVVASVALPSGTTTSQFAATISWGDGGATSQGSLQVIPSGIEIRGSRQYASTGSFPIEVTLIRLADNQRSIGKGTVVVTGPVSAVLDVTGLTVKPVAGLSFTGAVASIKDGAPVASPSAYTATIDWGDQSPITNATIVVNASGGFDVIGTHAYVKPGVSLGVVATIRRTSDGKVAQAEGKADVAAPTLTVGWSSDLVMVEVGKSLSGVVATFHDNNPSAADGQYTVSVDWGDGNVSTLGQDLTLLNQGGGNFGVVASHLYGAIATVPVSMKVTRIVGGQIAIATATVTVKARSFTGGLDPASPSGVSRTNQPRFRGTAPPFSVVQLSARGPVESSTPSLGSTIAKADGRWTLTVGPLANGVYAITATVAPSSGQTVLEEPLQTLVIQAGPVHAGRSWSGASVLPTRNAALSILRMPSRVALFRSPRR